MQPDQLTVPCVLMRGGTSKALFFHAADIPGPGPDRDRLLKRIMGTPDMLQIDGLGGSRLVTSKIAIISRSLRADADIDYTFSQVDVEHDRIGYDGNCGNISSAVGPFAIDEGLVEAVEPITTVRIYNTNTDKLLVARVPVRGGKASVVGDCAIPGVPGTGAEILMDYAGTVGAKTGKLLPTGNVIDRIGLEDGRTVDATLCDVANPCVFVPAAQLGLIGNELPQQISANAALIHAIAEIQARAGQMFGLWSDWTSVRLPGLPLCVIVAKPDDYIAADGKPLRGADMDLRARLVFLGKCHDSMAGTGSMCTAAASRIPGSVVNQALGDPTTPSPALRIGHPLGVMHVRVEASAAAVPTDIRYPVLGLARTARRLMSGAVHVPREVAEGTM